MRGHRLQTCDARPVGYTLVSFHAHPDDEALLTGGTLARAAAEGHRVVLVVATDGAAGLAAGRLRDDGGLAGRRSAELHRSAAALGCARVVELRFADSGWGDALPPPHAFSRLPVEEAAAPLARLLREERADVLTVYDPAGGYGHPDHRRVHEAGVLAARLAGTPVVLEATLDRRLLLRLVRVVAAVPRLLPEVRPSALAGSYTAHSDITHRVDVRSYAPAKRRAMRAHVTQTTADEGTRALKVLLRMPPWVFRRVTGTEWFVERGRAAGAPLDDVFATLRG
jgi:LmbE family N-acetylglucosaminyl deacetylase